jgi:undecaprenyl diphosphate synthase
MLAEPKSALSDPNASTVPRHVAVVMDGNGRWARSRFMPRFFGHKAGVDSLVRAVNLFADRGVEFLSVFAFSSENWKRPSEEVSGLMSLVLVAVSKYLGKLNKDGVRIRIVGDRAAVSDQLRRAWEEAETLTQHNTRITLAVAFNYGGRWDMVQACRQAAQQAVTQGLGAEQIEKLIDEPWVSQNLQMAFAPDPDLFIRTGGEMRISNFMLWQSAYAEFFFTDCLWPDFGAAEIDRALAAYAQRDRRFGAIRPPVVAAAG